MNALPNSPKNSGKTAPSRSRSCLTTSALRDERDLEQHIIDLIEDPRNAENPLREPLAQLFARYQDQLDQLERLTAISDGYQSALRDQTRSLADRYRRQIRQLRKIVLISDHYQEILREANQGLQVASTQDPLTGLPNRRFMRERLAAETALANRSGTPFSLAVIDVDHFKSVNDQYGHDAGDAILVAIARAMVDGLRAYDVCARWGGEEFVVLLPGTQGSVATDVAGRLRRKVRASEHPELSPSYRATISIGVAEHQPGAPYEETLKRADRALYEAKNIGRDRTVLAP